MSTDDIDERIAIKESYYEYLLKQRIKALRKSLGYPEKDGDD